MPGLGKRIWDAVNARNYEELDSVLHGKVEPADLDYEQKYFKDWGLMTALMLASYKGYTDMVEMLVKAGADIHKADNEGGFTALLWALYNKQTATGQMLLHLGSKVNFQVKRNGWTALIYAASWGHLDTVRVLLEWGADKNVRNTSGEIAARYAKNEEIRTLINTHKFSGTLPSVPSALPVPKPTTTSSSTAPPVVPSPAEVAAVECAELEGECDTLGEQLAQAPARRDAMQRRDALQAQLDAAKAAKSGFKLIGDLGQALKAVLSEISQLPLSEEDYLTLAARHAALVQRVEAKCQQLMEAEHYDLLSSLGAKLEQLQALDLSAAMPACDTDPVWVETSAGADKEAVQGDKTR